LKDCGIFVGAAGYILGTAHAVRKSVIVAFNNKPIRNLDDFIKVVSEIEQGARVPVKYYSLSRPLKTKVMIAHVDWRWHLFRLAVRNGI
jgi:hypothetical protein